MSVGCRSERSDGLGKGNRAGGRGVLKRCKEESSDGARGVPKRCKDDSSDGERAGGGGGAGDVPYAEGEGAVR